MDISQRKWTVIMNPDVMSAVKDVQVVGASFGFHSA
jgi:hypothetical protein